MQETELTMIASRRSKQRARGGEAEFVELIVDRRLFFNVEVAGRDVGFGLVVVVVGNEVLDGVVGEELFEFVVKLGRERLVVHLRMSAGRCDCSMTLAMVKVLPDPVTPSSDLVQLSPALKAADESSEMARGLVALETVVGD